MVQWCISDAHDRVREVEVERKIPQALSRMNSSSAAQLHEDYKLHAERIPQGATNAQVKELSGLPTNRAERLAAWLRTHPSAIPGRDGVPVHVRSPSVRKPRVLVFGDAHSEPGQDNWRFRAAGRMAAELLTGPDDVGLFIGDVIGLSSMCHHSKLSERLKHKVVADVAAADAALDEVKAGQGSAQISWKVTGGNHEHRIIRWEQEHPWFEGLVNIRGMFEEKGFEYYDYLEPLIMFGTRYQHCFANKMGRTIGGKNLCRTILNETKYAHSVVFGHTHEYHNEWSRDSSGRVRRAVNVACYFDHHEDYAGDQNDYWYRGAFLFTDCEDGNFNITEFPMDKIKERWG